MNKNTLRIGTSGSGKSTCAVQDWMSMVGNTFIDLYDPQGDTADLFIEQLEGVYDKVLVDDLNYTDKVLPLNILLPSTSEDSAEIAEHNNQQKEDLLDILGRQLETPLEQQPVKMEYTEHAISLWQNLKPELRNHLTPNMMTEPMKPYSEYGEIILNGCQKSEPKSVIRRARTLHESTRIKTIGSAQRLIDQFLNKPQVVVRLSNKPVSLEKLIKERWVRITKARKISPRVCRIIMGMRSIEVMNWADGHPGEQIHLIFEEYANFGLCGQPEITGLNTLRKRGVTFDFISQYPTAEWELREAQDQNCGNRIAHRCGSFETAEYVSRWLLGSLDPHKVHHTTQRAVYDGYETFIRKSATELGSIKERITHNEAERSRYKILEDNHYQSLSDQQTLLINDIQNGLKVGERYVNDNGVLRREYVPLPKSRYPWKGIAEERVQRWLEEMRKSDYYVTPNLDGLNGHKMETVLQSHGGKETKQSSKGMKRTPAR